MEELNQKIGTLEKEKNKEEEYRNYMQLERVSAKRPACYGMPTSPLVLKWIAGLCYDSRTR